MSSEMNYHQQTSHSDHNQQHIPEASATYKQDEYFSPCAKFCFFFWFVIAVLILMVVSLLTMSLKKQHEYCRKSNAWICLIAHLWIGAFMGRMLSSRAKHQNREAPASHEVHTPLHLDSTFLCLGLTFFLPFTIWTLYELVAIHCVSKFSHTLLFGVLIVLCFCDCLATVFLIRWTLIASHCIDGPARVHIAHPVASDVHNHDEQPHPSYTVVNGKIMLV